MSFNWGLLVAAHSGSPGALKRREDPTGVTNVLRDHLGPGDPPALFRQGGAEMLHALLLHIEIDGAVSTDAPAKILRGKENTFCERPAVNHVIQTPEGSSHAKGDVATFFDSIGFKEGPRLSAKLLAEKGRG